MLDRNESQNILMALSRDEIVYHYLLTLTDLSIPESNIQKKTNKKYSVTSITEQWGTDRMFVTRVMKNIIPSDSADKYAPLPKLDIDKLVEILSSLRTFWTERNSPKRIGRLEIVKALRLFSQLSTIQEESLALNKNGSQVLLQQLEDNINDLDYNLIPETVKNTYNFFINEKLRGFERENYYKSIVDEEEYIKNEIKDIIDLCSEEMVNEYYKKIVLEKNRSRKWL
jgi:hypothetical protein